MLCSKTHVLSNRLLHNKGCPQLEMPTVHSRNAQHTNAYLHNSTLCLALGIEMTDMQGSAKK